MSSECNGNMSNKKFKCTVTLVVFIICSIFHACCNKKCLPKWKVIVDFKIFKNRSRKRRKIDERTQPKYRFGINMFPVTQIFEEMLIFFKLKLSLS